MIFSDNDEIVTLLSLKELVKKILRFVFFGMLIFSKKNAQIIHDRLDSLIDNDPDYDGSCDILEEDFLNCDNAAALATKCEVNITSPDYKYREILNNKTMYELFMDNSESIGRKLVLYLFNSFEIKFHPQIIASLLAIATFLLILIAFKVGPSPLKPVIEHIV